MKSPATTQHPLTGHSQPSLRRERRIPARLVDPRIVAAPLGVLNSAFPFIAAIRGRVGDRVFKTYRDKIVVTRVPRFDGYIPTAAQRLRRDRMREATAYAQRIYAHPAAKAFYVTAARKLHRQPFRLAISDYLSDSTAA